VVLCGVPTVSFAPKLRKPYATTNTAKVLSVLVQRSICPEVHM
jgi:hypothetical protein